MIKHFKIEHIIPPILNFKVMYLRFILLVFLFCFQDQIFAQEYSITRTVFLPAVYHVGDKVELRIGIRSPYIEDIIQVLQPEQPSWGEIHDIRLQRRDSEIDIRIQFTSYYPGTQTLPPIDLGVLSIRDFSIFVTPLLEGSELKPSEGQVLLPGTGIVLALAIVFFVSFIFLILPFFKQMYKLIQRLVNRYKTGIPFRNTSRNLKELSTSAGILEGRTFYIQLLDLLRDYLQRRVQIDARFATTEEIQKSLKLAIENKKDCDFIIQLFHEGDLVKFAAKPSTLKSRMGQIDKLQNVLTSIESTYNPKEMQ